MSIGLFFYSSSSASSSSVSLSAMWLRHSALFFFLKTPECLSPYPLLPCNPLSSASGGMSVWAAALRPSAKNQAAVSGLCSGHRCSFFPLPLCRLSVLPCSFPARYQDVPGNQSHARCAFTLNSSNQKRDNVKICHIVLLPMREKQDFRLNWKFICT